MIWGLVIITLLALVVVFTTHSPGLLALALVVALGGATALALLFIDRHVRASSRPEHMTPGELAALKATLRKGAPPRLPPTHEQ